MVAKKVQAVIYDMKKGEPYFLILHRILRWHGWELHKGTVEDGESYEQTLKREIVEETSLKKFRVIKPLHMSFYFNKGKNLMVEVFLIKASMKQHISFSKNPKKEHDGYLWADKKTALEKLTWPDARKIIRKLKV